MNSHIMNSKTNFSDVTKAQLIADFKIVMSDAEALIKATANQGGDAIEAVRNQAAKSIAMAKASVIDVEMDVLARSKEVVKEADIYVHENPWQAIGVGAGIGLLIGFLVARR